MVLKLAKQQNVLFQRFGWRFRWENGSTEWPRKYQSLELCRQHVDGDISRLRCKNRVNSSRMWRQQSRGMTYGDWRWSARVFPAQQLVVLLKRALDAAAVRDSCPIYFRPASPAAIPFSRNDFYEFVCPAAARETVEPVDRRSPEATISTINLGQLS